MDGRIILCFDTENIETDDEYIEFALEYKSGLIKNPLIKWNWFYLQKAMMLLIWLLLQQRVNNKK